VRDVGPTMLFRPDGLVIANGRKVINAPPGTWCHVEIRFALGADAPKEYRLLVRSQGVERKLTIPFKHKTFDEVRWLGIVAADDADAVFYLDNLVLQVDFPRPGD